MSKKWRLIIITVLCILLAVFIGSCIKRGNMPLRIKNGGVVSITGLTRSALDLEAKGKFVEARAVYQRLINEFPNSSEVMNWQKKAENLNIKIIFSSGITENSIVYTIKTGDTLAKIAREFKTTQELIKKSNNLANDTILPGKKIKVWTHPFTIVVDKSQNTLILKTDEEIVKTYVVSTGVNNSTPVGTFKIINKLPNPTWFKAGAVVSPGSPENILGTRWLGLNIAGYGIHGTTEAGNLGKQVTQGCIRMSNSDVEELYTIVGEGTEVTILD